MSLALFISIKDKPDGFEDYMCGKYFAHAWDALDVIAPIINVPVMNKLCNSAWKNPDKGLPIFKKYLDYIRQNPSSVPDSLEVIDDLEDVVRLIGEAKRLNTKWRLLLDY